MTAIFLVEVCALKCKNCIKVFCSVFAGALAASEIAECPDRVAMLKEQKVHTHLEEQRSLEPSWGGGAVIRFATSGDARFFHALPYKAPPE
jgi:hypothetical protein